MTNGEAILIILSVAAIIGLFTGVIISAISEADGEHTETTQAVEVVEESLPGGETGTARFIAFTTGEGYRYPGMFLIGDNHRIEIVVLCDAEVSGGLPVQGDEIEYTVSAENCTGGTDVSFVRVTQRTDTSTGL